MAKVISLSKLLMLLTPMPPWEMLFWRLEISLTWESEVMMIKTCKSIPQWIRRSKQEQNLCIMLICRLLLRTRRVVSMMPPLLKVIILQILLIKCQLIFQVTCLTWNSSSFKISLVTFTTLINLSNKMRNKFHKDLSLSRGSTSVNWSREPSQNFTENLKINSMLKSTCNVLMRRSWSIISRSI
jgi:hypothetical protein